MEKNEQRTFASEVGNEQDEETVDDKGLCIVSA